MRPALLSAALMTVVLAAAWPAAAQGTKAASQPSAKAWTPPRTPWGHPDLQGTWTNPTITPFERPAALGDKQVLTDEEAAQVEQRAAENRVDRP